MPFPRTADEDKCANNAPNKVRRSFLNYLKKEFPYSKSWTHPTGGIHSHELIKKVLLDYKKMDQVGYRALWYLWTTQGTRSFVADRLNFSSPTIKRKWDKSINIIMLMLLFSDLQPESFVLYTGISE